MNKLPQRVVLTAVVLLILLIIGTLLPARLRADSHRDALIALLETQTGSRISLHGPLSFAFGLKGLRLVAEDLALTPPNAHIPSSIGRAELGLKLPPLLNNTMIISRLSLERAEFFPDTLTPAVLQRIKTPQSHASASTAPNAPLLFDVDRITIKNSRVTFYDRDDVLKTVDLYEAVIDNNNLGEHLFLSGTFEGQPFQASLRSALPPAPETTPFSFEGGLAYASFAAAVSGQLDIPSKRLTLSIPSLSASHAKLTGVLETSWQGERPQIRGRVLTPALALTDLRTTPPEDTSNLYTLPVFSDTPLPVKALRSFDGIFDIEVGSFTVGKATFRPFNARLALKDGLASFRATRAALSDHPVDLVLTLDARTALPRLDLKLEAPKANLRDALGLVGFPPLLSGKASASVLLTGAGQTPRQIAQTLQGYASILAEDGQIFKGAAGRVSSFLARLLGTSSDDNTLNCLAARFIAQKGVFLDNGILLDSATVTVRGRGGVDLGSETLSFALRTRPKLVDVSGLIPALTISGPLLDPSFSIDAGSMVKNALSSLTKGDFDILSSDVPAILKPPAGQNACAYTLVTPDTGPQTDPTLTTSDTLSSVTDSIKDWGESLFGGSAPLP